MEYLVLIAKAVISGFIVAVPMGAVAALCIRRTLERRLLTGLAIGCGAAVADAALAAGAALGLSLIVGYLISHMDLVRYVGGVLLIALGAILYRAAPPGLDHMQSDKNPAAIADIANLAGALASGFALTIFNPATFLAFVATFAALNILDGVDANLTNGTLLIGGVFLGSALWWLVLCSAARLLRSRLSDSMFSVIDKGLALFIVGVGVVAILQPL